MTPFFVDIYNASVRVRLQVTESKKNGNNYSSMLEWRGFFLVFFFVFFRLLSNSILQDTALMYKTLHMFVIIIQPNLVIVSILFTAK